MYLPFESMPEHTRLWIYQADRQFEPSEKILLEKGLRNLCDEWAAHGTPLRTSFSIFFNRFVILSVDERAAGASGCSIDGSVRYLKGLQAELGLDFFDRTQVAFFSKNEVLTFPVSALKQLFENGTLTADTLTFNNLVTTLGEWKNSWQIKVKESWLTRYLPKTTVPD